MGALLRVARRPGRLHDARPAHPHRAPPRLGQAWLIQNLFPRPRPPRRVQVRDRLPPSRLDVSPDEHDGAGRPTASRWLPALLERGVAVLHRSD